MYTVIGVKNWLIIKKKIYYFKRINLVISSFFSNRGSRQSLTLQTPPEGEGRKDCNSLCLLWCFNTILKESLYKADSLINWLLIWKRINLGHVLVRLESSFEVCLANNTLMHWNSNSCFFWVWEAFWNHLHF